MSQYFDFIDCGFYLCVSSADNGLEMKQNQDEYWYPKFKLWISKNQIMDIQKSNYGYPN